MRKTAYPVILFLLLGTLILSSCDDFYGSSWGSPREYDPSNIKLSLNNLNDWVENAIGNPELSRALLKRIKSDSSNLPDDADKAKYQEAGVKLAVEASGIGSSIISNAAGALDQLGENNEDAVKDILASIQNDFKKNNGAEAAGYIAGIVDVSTGNIPKIENDDYARLVTPVDAGQSVMVLALAAIGDINKHDTLAIGELGIGLIVEGGNVKFSGTPAPTHEVRALAAYLNLIADDRADKFDANPITKAVRDAFGLSRT
jgi:hypothetical protein